MASKVYTIHDDQPTPRVSKSTHTDLDHTVGQLMVESINHHKRLQTLEALVENAGIVPGSMRPGSSRRTELFVLARKTFTTTAVIIAALISALKELGFIPGH